jgi:hypothetical protein
MKRILSYISGKSWEVWEQRIEEEAKKTPRTHQIFWDPLSGDYKLNNAS